MANASVRITLNKPNIRKLLRSPEMLADLERRAQRIAAAAGDGFEVDSDVGPNRARAAVIARTHEARHAEATRRALTMAIDAGR